MKPTIYIETSVVSYFTGRASRDVVIAGHQQCTIDFWSLLSHALSPYSSAIVIQEASNGDPKMAQKRVDALKSFPILPISEEAENLANRIVNEHGVPAKYPEDALHIAIAATGGVDFIVTWNFTHINNPFTKLKIRRIVQEAGYHCPEIVTPEAFLGGNDENQ